MIFKARRQISVRTVGDPVLSKPAAPILSVTPETVQLANEMLEALRVFNGIGIAAPQYGVSLRLVVLDVPEEFRGQLVLNQIAVCETALEAHDFLHRLQAIETAQGRVRGPVLLRDGAHRRQGSGARAH